MSKEMKDIYELADSYEYDLINIVVLDNEILQEGFDLEGIISCKKKVSEINLIAVKDHNVTIMTFSKMLVGTIENLSNYIKENSFYNKKLSLYYLNMYKKDACNKKKNVMLQRDTENIKFDMDMLSKIIEHIYGYKIISLLSSNITTKIENINSYKVRRQSEHQEIYIEGLVKTDNNIMISFNNRSNCLNIEERLELYKNKFKLIYDLEGLVKISGYALACLVRQLMNALNSDAVNSDLTFIKSNFFGKKIFSSHIDIIDHPGSSQFYHKNSFDHNGILTKKKYLIKKGVLYDLLGDVNSSLRNGLAGPGNYYKKFSDLTNGLIMYRNILLEVNKYSKENEFAYEIKEFSIDSFLNIQTGQFCGSCYGFRLGSDSKIPIVCSIAIDIMKFFNGIQSISGQKRYDDVICPDVVVKYGEIMNDKN